MTPYDTALRIAERRLDAVRTAIGAIVAELERIEQARIAIECAVMRESAIVAHDHRLGTEPFFARARDQQLSLAAARAAAHVQLEALRRKAVEHYGAQMALDGAVATFHAEAARARDAAEQAVLDDRTGARHAAGTQGRRRAAIAAAAR